MNQNRHTTDIHGSRESSQYPSEERAQTVSRGERIDKPCQKDIIEYYLKIKQSNIFRKRHGVVYY